MNDRESEIPVMEQIRHLIDRADQMEDIDFRLQLEDLVRKGGNETLNLIIHYITVSSAPVKTRLNLIRIAGYILHNAFIPPLQKVIDLSPDLNLRIAAIVSIAKFNDRRAIDILEQSLAKISNPSIQELIISQINRIKRNSPLINMMPQFLRGSSDPESFPIIVKIFRRILTPSDVKGFIPYLQNPDPRIEDGAFAILCSRGDGSVRFFLAEFFKRKLAALDPGAQPAVLTGLLSALAEYAERVPSVVGFTIDELSACLRKTKGKNVEDQIEKLLKMAPASDPENPRRE
jgi:hypothetical protein